MSSEIDKEQIANQRRERDNGDGSDRTTVVRKCRERESASSPYTPQTHGEASIHAIARRGGRQTMEEEGDVGSPCSVR